MSGEIVDKATLHSSPRFLVVLVLKFLFQPSSKTPVRTNKWSLLKAES
jgi:hypothetical protein